jgi:lysophospholipase L1-like esterase
LKQFVIALVFAIITPVVAPPAFGVAKKKRTAKRPVVRRAPPIKPRRDLIPAITAEVQNNSVSIENPSALIPFFERLHRNEAVSVLHYGDSHTAADIWTGELRRLFQGRFGDGGAGFSHAGRPWNSYRREDVRSSGSKRWYTDGLFGRPVDGMYGLAGVSIDAHRPGEWVSLHAGGPLLQVWYLQQPEGGSIVLTDGGEVLETISTAGELGPGYYEAEVSPGPHDYRLTTTDGHPVRLFGWVTGNREGLTYEMLGINGAQASMVLDGNAGLLADQLHRRKPALIVLAFGTNEAGNKSLTEARYGDILRQVISRFRDAAPDASLLLVGPPDRSARQRGRWVQYIAVDRIVATQRAIAVETGCAFYDLRGKMGGTGVMHRWVVAGLAQFDHVHLTASGYRLIAQALYADVTAQFDGFVRARHEQ